MRLALFALFALSTVTLAGASSAAAQDGAESCRQVRPGLVQCAPTVIEGRRPRAYFLLGRARDRWEAPPLRARDLMGRVRRTVRQEPF